MEKHMKIGDLEIIQRLREWILNSWDIVYKMEMIFAINTGNSIVPLNRWLTMLVLLIYKPTLRMFCWYKEIVLDALQIHGISREEGELLSISTWFCETYVLETSPLFFIVYLSHLIGVVIACDSFLLEILQSRYHVNPKKKLGLIPNWIQYSPLLIAFTSREILVLEDGIDL